MHTMEKRKYVTTRTKSIRWNTRLKPDQLIQLDYLVALRKKTVGVKENRHSTVQALILSAYRSATISIPMFEVDDLANS